MQEPIQSHTSAFGGSEIIYQPYSSGTMTMKEGLARESCKGLDVADWSSAQEIPQRGTQHAGYAVFCSSSSLEWHTAFQIGLAWIKSSLIKKKKTAETLAETQNVTSSRTFFFSS